MTTDTPTITLINYTDWGRNVAGAFYEPATPADSAALSALPGGPPDLDGSLATIQAVCTAAGVRLRVRDPELPHYTEAGLRAAGACVDALRRLLDDRLLDCSLRLADELADQALLITVIGFRPDLVRPAPPAVLALAPAEADADTIGADLLDHKEGLAAWLFGLELESGTGDSLLDEEGCHALAGALQAVILPLIRPDLAAWLDPISPPLE